VTRLITRGDVVLRLQGPGLCDLKPDRCVASDQIDSYLKPNGRSGIMSPSCCMAPHDTSWPAAALCASWLRARVTRSWETNPGLVRGNDTWVAHRGPTGTGQRMRRPQPTGSWHDTCARRARRDDVTPWARYRGHRAERAKPVLSTHSKAPT
jgi:hypothetical protein